MSRTLQERVAVTGRPERPGASLRDSVRTRFPFLTPIVRKWRRVACAIRDHSVRTGTLLEPGADGTPLSSLRIHGAHDGSPLAVRLHRAFTSAIGSDHRLPDAVYEIEGMSGRAFRTLLNELMNAIEPARYLEIGSWRGSTVIAALFGNGCRALCVDDWSQFDGAKRDLVRTLRRFELDDRVEIAEADFRAVDYRAIGQFDVLFFDGPHAAKDHHDGILLTQPALRDEYVLLVDDWNWLPARKGTLGALAAAGASILFAIEIRTTQDDRHTAHYGGDWHNGCFLAVVKKSG